MLRHIKGLKTDVYRLQAPFDFGSLEKQQFVQTPLRVKIDTLCRLVARDAAIEKNAGIFAIDEEPAVITFTVLAILQPVGIRLYFQDDAT